MKICVSVFALIIALFGTMPAFSHSGGTDKNGCHHDNVHGGYHCH
ncbi:YHYH domain-containing protein [Mesorhizobium sp. ISC25]